ncbi:hypothetical protein I302_106807 [Kwoniella bestiolae CBS 10118]|uniref:SH3 domain-containing protein n=1 Tax=Kwoniella bestiolae CBS 10118 TaxID=1296100 RepID=A0A1B9G0C9_9TREE|nr:hypothetical protein I302_05927 [Kwoniella bestiolae CBS 10118]OCF24467.1 hypothetical protein I302_05927 [Kwoniella bestiolae CBS 10118]
MSYPYLAKTTLKYKSPHATDLSFAKDETIRVTGPNPDDEDWLIGENLDGSKSGGFPKDFIVPLEETESEAAPESEPLKNEVAEPPSAIKEDPPPVSIKEPAPPSPTLSPQSRLPTPGIAPSPAPPSPVEPPAPTQPSAPSAPAPAPSSQSKPTNPTDSPPRPQSMKDRLAFFAAAQDKPAPPPIKPKPQTGGLTWSQRQKLRQEQEAKERESNPTPAPAAPPPANSTPSAPAAQDTSSTSAEAKKDETEEGKGMSAADAISSITKGGSLKERMAALQGHGAFGGGSSESKPAPPPVSSGKVWKRPAAPAPEPEPEVEGDEDAASTEKPERVRSPPVIEEGENAAPPEGQEATEEGEEDEEEKEKARRAAIAARMAKLGARGPMGMMPPAKPTRKPTRESTSSPAEEKAEPALAPAPATSQEEETKPAVTAEEPSLSAAPPPAESAQTETTSSAAPPKSIPIAAMPRRTAPPKRRTPAPTSSGTTTSAETVRENPAEPEKRFETTDESGAAIPPPQVMVAGEEDSLPKTEKGVQKEKEAEEVGKGAGGLEGAAAAGIALAPVDPSSPAKPQAEEEENRNAPLEPELPEDKDEPLVGAVGGADSPSRGTGTVTTQDESAGGEIVDKSAPVQEVEEGIVEGGDEKDDILKEAQEGRLNFEEPNDPLDEDTPTPLSPDPIGMVPIHPPAPNGSEYDIDEPPPPLPPARRPRGLSLDVPLDELELKHEHEHTHDSVSEQPVEDDDEEDAPPPPLPSQRRVSGEKPAGPRPLPSPGRDGRALPPPPVGSALIPPREDSDDEDEEEDDVPPPPPARPQPPVTHPKEEEEEEEEDIPPPPPPGRPVPPPAQEVEDEDDEDVPPPLPSARHLPPPPTGQSGDSAPPPPARAPPPPVEQQEEEEEEDAPPPPPPARKPSMLAPIQVGVPTPASAPKSPSSTSPVAASSPARARAPTSEEPPSSPKAEDGDATRRSGIAARMAKLGGIKFGMPPPTFKKPQNITSPSSELPPAEEGHVDSPIDKEPPLPSPRGEVPASPVRGGAEVEGEETPEQEAARRRATLARLRAGGALGGFGLFNPGGAAEAEEPKEDLRGIEQEKPVQAAEQVEDDEDDAPPPPPPVRPPVPGGRPVLSPPADLQEEGDTPPPPPPGRPTISTSLGNDQAPPPPARVPQTPTSPIVGSPVRTPSGRRPPVPLEKRFSSSHKRTSTASSAIILEDQPTSSIGSGEWQISDEPAAIMSSQLEQGEEDAPPPPPNRPPPPPQVQAQARPPQGSPRRSGSILSRKSRTSIDIAPPTPSKVPQQQEVPPSPVQQTLARQPSMSQGGGGRPGFDQLKEASQTYGAQLARSAHNIFAQGKRAQVGDGSPAGFVFFAMDNAQLPRPNLEKGWGQVVFEQEGGSILRRYDDPRPGDIAAFHDSKLKGKKGLSTYNQHVGSVEEPLIGIVAEFEERKHKLRVLQVERGVPEEVSYRCEDLKSGKIIVYRPGL